MVEIDTDRFCVISTAQCGLGAGSSPRQAHPCEEGGLRVKGVYQGVNFAQCRGQALRSRQSRIYSVNKKHSWGEPVRAMVYEHRGALISAGLCLLKR